MMDRDQRKDVDDKLEACAAADGLTRWEQSFIEDLAEQLDGSAHITEKQLEILNRIHREKV